MKQAVWLVGAFAAAACGSDGGGDGGSEPALKASLDLTGVIGFAISGGGSQRGARPDDPTTSTLYAITEDGELVITTVMTDGSGDAGTSTTTEEPLGIYDTPKYVVFAYRGVQAPPPDGQGPPETCSGVILRKSDGALYCYSASSVTEVHADGSGDALFVKPATSGLTLVDLTTEPPQATSVIDFESMLNAAVLDVNTSGDALVAFDTMSQDPMGLRVYKSGGGLQNVLARRPACQWRDPTGTADDFGYVDFGDAQMAAPFQVIKLQRQADGSFVPSEPTTGPTAAGPCAIAYASGDLVLGWWTVGLSGPTNELVELVGEIGTAHAVPAMERIDQALSTDSEIFVRGTNGNGDSAIVRVDVADFAATTLLSAGDFSLTAISLSRTGDLTFAGLRNADGARIIGNVPAGSDTYTILSADAPQVTTLQRIN